MKLSKYIFGQDPQGSDRPFIIGTEYPCVLATPMMFDEKNPDSKERLLSSMANGRTFAAKVPGFNIYISYSGTMAKDIVEDDLDTILREMAEFYLDYKIRPHFFKFKKYQDSFSNGNDNF